VASGIQEVCSLLDLDRVEFSFSAGPSCFNYDLTETKARQSNRYSLSLSQVQEFYFLYRIIMLMEIQHGKLG